MLTHSLQLNKIYDSPNYFCKRNEQCINPGYGRLILFAFANIISFSNKCLKLFLPIRFLSVFIRRSNFNEHHMLNTIGLI